MVQGSVVLDTREHRLVASICFGVCIGFCVFNFYGVVMNKIIKLLVIVLICYSSYVTSLIISTRRQVKEIQELQQEQNILIGKCEAIANDSYQFSKDLIAFMMVSYTITSPDPVKGMTKILRDKGYSDTEVRFFIGNSHTLLNNESERLYGKNLNQLFTDKTYRPFNGKDNFFNDFWRK